jgi:hypothetical protein
MIHDRQFEREEWAASAIRDDIVRVTRGRPMHWVVVQEVAHRLGLEENVVKAAVQSAIEKGWLVGDGTPPDSVRLSTGSVNQADEMRDFSCAGRLP